MGEAKRKQALEEERRAAEERRRREERARWNNPRGRRIAKPIAVMLDGVRYELHVDGSVYEDHSRGCRRVKDRALALAVQKRAAELYPAMASPTSARAASA